MPIKQFKWIDRDTAARDILQLVYHAPPQIAEQAAKLLNAIRSPAIISDLKAMFLDAEYDVHLRREIYKVICAIQGNFDFSEFEAVISEVFGSYNFYSYVFGLLKHHPTNLVWIMRDIENKRPSEQILIYSIVGKDFPNIAIEPLLKLLVESPYRWGLLTAQRIYQIKDTRVESFLVTYVDKILYLWLTHYQDEVIDMYKSRLHAMNYWDEWLNQWPELKNALARLTPEDVLRHIEHENVIRQKSIYIRLLPYASNTASTLLLKLIEENHVLLDLEMAGLLHEYGDEIVQNWLVARWDELVYLCLVDSIGIQDHSEKMRIVHILEKWPELKEAVFHNCPAFIEEYEQIRTEENKVFSQPVSDGDIQASPVWQAMEQHRDKWVQQTEIGEYTPLFLHELTWHPLRSESDIPNFAAETYFLGTILPYSYHHFGNRLRHLLRRSTDQWRRVITMEDDPNMTFVYSPIRFEAAYAIRNIIEPSNWECMVQTFLMCINELSETPASLEENLLRWISRMTDMLSGVEPELPDEEIPLNARPWFCALVKQNPS